MLFTYSLLSSVIHLYNNDITQLFDNVIMSKRNADGIKLHSVVLTWTDGAHLQLSGSPCDLLCYIVAVWIALRPAVLYSSCLDRLATCCAI